jgi:predicted RNase H-like HicB family nuclease
VETRRNLWVLVKPSADVRGEWVAHCLDLDVVTQGRNPTHAVQMIGEALALAIEDDLRQGRDPFARSRAPAEYWDELHRVTGQGEPSPVLPAESQSLGALAFQLRTEVRTEAAETHPVLFWQLAA